MFYTTDHEIESMEYDFKGKMRKKVWNKVTKSKVANKVADKVVGSKILKGVTPNLSRALNAARPQAATTNDRPLFGKKRKAAAAKRVAERTTSSRSVSKRLPPLARARKEAMEANSSAPSGALPGGTPIVSSGIMATTPPVSSFSKDMNNLSRDPLSIEDMEDNVQRDVNISIDPSNDEEAKKKKKKIIIIAVVVVVVVAIIFVVWKNGKK